MPIHRLLRSSAAVYLFPLVALYLAVTLQDAQQFLQDNWRAGSVLASSAALSAFAPAGAALGAWEAWRLRRAGVHPGVAVRSPLTVMAGALLPILAFALLGTAAAYAVVASQLGGLPGGPDPLVIAVGVLVTIAWTTAGFVVGRWAHPAIGVPVMMVGTWLWLSYPAAMEPLWLRHLTGYNEGACCETGAVLDGRAIVAQAIIAGALTTASAGAWCLHTVRTICWTPLAALPVAAVITGVLLVQGLGPTAQRPRTSGLACRSHQGVEVCVWNERRAQLDRAARIVVPAARVLTRTGLPMPEKITEGTADGRTSWRFIAAPRADETEMRMSLASGFLPSHDLDCSKRSDWRGEEAYAPVGAWLVLGMGLGAARASEQVGSQAVEVAERVRTESRDRQLAWFRHNLKALAHCDVQPWGVTAS
ncbi:DUF7224 domain-containing protein [Actinomadura hibisca]|uniref:DUF7224 domain-containing protein n=1 Tax=Actinomadura hibisca TaxID=68565 RepID=UPI0008317F9A|nr:hypothetical protein [Actinomadura hibisca]